MTVEERFVITVSILETVEVICHNIQNMNTAQLRLVLDDLDELIKKLSDGLQ